MVEGADGQNPQSDGRQPSSAQGNASTNSNDAASNSDADAKNREPRVARTMLDISHIKPVRKVAKTLLDQSLPSENSQEQNSKDDGDRSNTPKRVKRISRTMLELDVQSLVEKAALEQLESKNQTDSSNIAGNLNAKSNQGESAPKASRAPSERYVAKTMLDHSMLFQAVSKSADKMEHKAAEIAKERANAPIEIIEPIVAERKVAKCPWTWSSSINTKERYHACGLCQAAVYDFAGVEREQADAIIFQRENVKKPKLYQRPDGKFMTRDCPREVARRVRLISACGLGAVVVVGSLMFMILTCQSAKIESVSASSSVTSNSISVDSQLGADSASSPASSAIPPNGPVVRPGWYHFENGKATRGAPVASEQPASTAPVTSVPGESDEMWQDTSKQ